MADAAHAMPPAIGQGANTAIEDSLELARQLAKAESAEYVFFRVGGGGVI